MRLTAGAVRRHSAFTIAAVIVTLARIAVGAGEGIDARPQDGPLVRVGEVDGRTFNRERSSFDARGTVFVTRRDDAVLVWNAQTLQPLGEPLAHPGLKAFVLSGDGRTVLTRDEDEVRLWDVATSTLRATIRPNRGDLQFGEISPDGSRVVTIDERDPQHINLWRAGEAKLERQLLHPGKIGNVTSAQFDPSGKRIVSYREAPDGSFKMHDPDGGPGVGSPVETDKEFWYPYVPKLDPRGGQFAFPRYRDLMIVDCDTGGRTIQSDYVNWGTYPVRLHFSADGSRISTVMDDNVARGRCQVFDADTGKFQHAFATGMSVCRLFGPGGRLAICYGGAEKTGRVAEVWDVEAGNILQRIANVWPMDVSPDGKTVLFGAPGGRKSVWRLKE